MRVLHVHSGNLYGGVETFLLSLARFRALAPSMDMSVALTSDGRIAADLRDAGVPVTILGEARISRPFTVWRARRVLASLLQSQRPDVDRLPSGVAARALWPCCKTPFHRARPLDAHGGQPALARPACMARPPWHGRLQQPVHGVDAAEVERPRRSGVRAGRCGRGARPRTLPHPTATPSSFRSAGWSR